MKTTSVINEDIARSVWAVPPIALGSENDPLTKQNVKLVKHIEAGGVETILWGGNANIYGMTAATFAATVEAIPDWVASGTWAIPSVGPDYGKLMEHAAILRSTAYPAAMLLPYAGPRNTAGTEAAIRDFVNTSGIPAILYLRQVSYLPPERIAALIEDGTVVALKYAVETGDLCADPYLDAILKQVPVELIISGIGEIAAIHHHKAFALSGFTAGAVCIAPKRSVAVHKAIAMGDWNAAELLCRPIQALEDLRIAHGAIPVLHTAITESGIVDMGRMRPHFGPLKVGIEALVRAAVEPLLELEKTFLE